MGLKLVYARCPSITNWSTVSRKHNMILLEAPTGTIFFYYEDIEQEILHTLLLKEYCVSKKWVIITYRMQDSIKASTPATKTVHLWLRSISVPEV